MFENTRVVVNRMMTVTVEGGKGRGRPRVKYMDGLVEVAPGNMTCEHSFELQGTDDGKQWLPTSWRIRHSEKVR